MPCINKCKMGLPDYHTWKRECSCPLPRLSALVCRDTAELLFIWNYEQSFHGTSHIWRHCQMIILMSYLGADSSFIMHCNVTPMVLQSCLPPQCQVLENYPKLSSTLQTQHNFTSQHLTLSYSCFSCSCWAVPGGPHQNWRSQCCRPARGRASICQQVQRKA